MIRTRFKKVLLVAPDVFPDRLLTDFKELKHITTVGGIFPALYKSNPDMIMLDYDYIGKDIEKILRRIKINKFYNKLKICCYKSGHNEKIDSLLIALGADHLIYKEDLAKPEKNKTVLNNFGTLLDMSILKWVASVSH
jgi:hypothetical protein